MNDLFFQLRNMCEHNCDGSATTQRDRLVILEKCAEQLIDMSYRKMNATSLKQKHVYALVNRWLAEGLQANTIRNRMSHLRWWSKKIGKTNVVLSNSDYGIPTRDNSHGFSKAQTLDEEKLKHITDHYVVASLRLQAAFGLRKEESIKFIPNYADQGDYIQLKASWCKGGRARTIPILNTTQREALAYAKTIAGSGSLIPKHLKYYEQRGIYEKVTNKVGLNKMHGLRHRYAQQRYQKLTGWPCPHAGGSKQKDLTPEQKAIDKEARLTISNELGHGRLGIVTTYCGA